MLPATAIEHAQLMQDFLEVNTQDRILARGHNVRSKVFVT
jgi:hypothetical protein